MRIFRKRFHIDLNFGPFIALGIGYDRSGGRPCLVFLIPFITFELSIDAIRNN